MPDTSQHSKTHHSHSHNRQSHKSSFKKYLEPGLYVSTSILLLIFAKLFATSMLSPWFGALGIIILAISKTWKFGFGVIFSTAFIFIMAMLNLFHWVNNYFSDVFADDLTFNPEILVPVIMEGLVLTIIVWTYHRLFNSSQMRLSRNWFDKKSYLLIFRLLFYFQLFLALLIVVEILIHILQPFTHLTTLNAALVSCAFALLATMIPAIIYFSKSTRVEKPKHIHHHHHHRHGRSSQQKNPESTPEPTQSQ